MSARHDFVAERRLLEIALSGHPSVAPKFLALPGDLWVESFEPVATVIRDRIRRNIPLDPLVIAADVAAAIEADGADTGDNVERARRFVLEASASSPAVGDFDHYAEQALAMRTIRLADRVVIQLHQQLEAATDPAEVAELVANAATQLADTGATLAPTATEPPISLQELLDQPDEPYDWIVPNLLERMDRLMLTAYEGVGKSTLLAQFALTLAAGAHPFTGDLIDRDGHRVLVVDAENSVRQIRRRYRKFVANINYLRETRALPPVDWSKQLRFVIQPAGIDLADPRDFARLEAKIAASAPDVVLAGPIYRLSKLDIRDEPAAKALVDALDQLRVKYKFTLIMEAHVGHAGETQGGRKLRPTGSSLLLRWPEFGIGLAPYGDAKNEEHPSVVELVPWRGSREERAFPFLIKHGENLLPWVVGHGDYDPGG
ncbi:ATP-binding protein [Amycolatopsis japonica]